MTNYTVLKNIFFVLLLKYITLNVYNTTFLIFFKRVQEGG